MMDVVQLFNDELQSLVETKPPVSKVKMGQITRAAMKGVKFYKHIVKGVEKFIARCGPDYKVPGLYVIDSIVRQSRHQFGVDRDVFAARFSNNLESTFENLFAGCNPDDKSKIVRVLNLWQKNKVFESHVIQPLLDMASPVATLTMDPKSPSSGDNNSLIQGQTSRYSHQYNNNNNNNSTTNSSTRHDRSTDSGLKFTKNMLDFDYDEDDDDGGDETPTEAEPPLSSTLSRIEMEQRSKRNDKSSHKNVSQHTSQKVSESDRFQTQQRPNHDPVLERWNRLLRQQSGEITPQEQKSPTLPVKTERRSRSRSPLGQPPTSYSAHQLSASRNLLDIDVKDTPQQQQTISHNSSSREMERTAERERKCLPKIRDKHLTVCSSTLWLGHVPKQVSEADISDAFGEFGTINSIDLIPPRGCAYVCMDRRQDAKRALNDSRHLKLNGSHIKMAWAPGKGFKEYKKLKDFWEADIGASFIPYSKIDESIDFDTLEEGGVIDEDSMSMEMRETRERKANGDKNPDDNPTLQPAPGLSLPLPVLPMLNQPPHPANIQPFAMPPPNMSIPPPLSLGQGLIPFPPPRAMQTTTTTSHMHASLPTTSKATSMSNNEISDNYELNQEGRDEMPPSSIDQQLSMTERQISMVEQQLNMIQQAQGMGQLPGLAPMQNLQQPIFFSQNQPNPMMFDMGPPHQLLHGAQPMLDPQQMAMFMNNPMQMMGQPPMMQMDQMNMIDPSKLDGLSQNQRDF